MGGLKKASSSVAAGQQAGAMRAPVQGALRDDGDVVLVPGLLAAQDRLHLQVWQPHLAVCCGFSCFVRTHPLLLLLSCHTDLRGTNVVYCCVLPGASAADVVALQAWCNAPEECRRSCRAPCISSTRLKQACDQEIGQSRDLSVKGQVWRPAQTGCSCSSLEDNHLMPSQRVLGLVGTICGVCNPELPSPMSSRLFRSPSA